MTDNQEKQLFKTLKTLVTGVNKIQSDVKEIKETLDEHSQILKKLDAKTDSIADTVMTNDKRLITVEKDVSDLRERIR